MGYSHTVLDREPASGPDLRRGSQADREVYIARNNAWQFRSAIRVPAVYLAWADLLFSAFLALSRISKLRRISGAQNSDSPRLHHVSH
jgi:hypothetical protein